MKGKDVEILSMWFTSNNKCVATYLTNATDPDNSPWKNELEFKSDKMVVNIFMNGEIVTTLTGKKIK